MGYPVGRQLWRRSSCMPISCESRGNLGQQAGYAIAPHDLQDWAFDGYCDNKKVLCERQFWCIYLAENQLFVRLDVGMSQTLSSLWLVNSPHIHGLVLSQLRHRIGSYPRMCELSARLYLQVSYATIPLIDHHPIMGFCCGWHIFFPTYPRWCYMVCHHIIGEALRNWVKTCRGILGSVIRG